MSKIKQVSNEQQLRDAIEKHFANLNGLSNEITSKIELLQDIGLTKVLDIPFEENSEGFTKQVFTRQYNKSLIIELNGCTIYDGTAIDAQGLSCLIRRKPLNQKAALDSVTWGLKIRNGKLRGKRFGGTNQTGALLYLGATFNSEISNIEFENASNGVELRFSMMARIVGCMVNGIDKTAIYVGKGDWEGAGDNSSQSNGTLIEQVRVFNQPESTAFKIECSSQVLIKKCISEGYSPKYHLLWMDYHNTTTVQDGAVEDFYIEAAGTIKIQTKAGHKVLKNIWMQNPTRFEFEALAAVATIYLQNIPYWPLGSSFECFGNTANLAVRAEEVAVDIRNNKLWLNSETYFPKISNEVKGMPRYISYSSTVLNKFCSNSDIRFNNVLAAPGLPQNLKTNSPVKIESNSVGGTASAGNNDGGMFIVKRGVVCRIGSTQPPTIDTNDGICINDANGEGLFNYQLTNLVSKTTYTLRSFAYNGRGTSYGEIQIITTL